MHVIRQTGPATLSATSPYGLVGAKLIAGTSVTITDGAARNVMALGAVGDFILSAPIQMTGLITSGTFTDLYLYVE
jgi:hypothetical protein